MITLTDISHAYASQTIFDHASCSISSSDRIGLVGLNGTGKTTLLRFIAQLERPDEGTIARDEQVRVAYLPQDLTFSSSKTVLDELVSDFEHVDNSLVAQGKKVLSGLGFSEELMHTALSTLSTGWKMRALLAKLLVKRADFYLFDEPTNHLDLQTRDWLISFLAKVPFGFIIVSHDKFVLDSLCTAIIEIDQQVITRYRGNYSAYKTQKQLNQEQQLKAYEAQQRERARKEATISRFRAKASKARMAKSMAKQLDKEELLEPPSAPPETIHLTFPSIPTSPRIVLDVRNVSHRFDEAEPLFSAVSFQIERKDRAALVAPNGAGKTTLIKLMVGDYELQTGSVAWGRGVQIAVFHQDHARTLDQWATIWETVNRTTKKPDTFVRSLLGALLFSKDAIDKPISVLSGGERVRVGLAQLLLQDANVLILDEPTNHLDIPSQEALLSVLAGYPGTIVFVSHDRDFLNNLATKIIELTGHRPTGHGATAQGATARGPTGHGVIAREPTGQGATAPGATVYAGNYDAYLTQKAARGEDITAHVQPTQAGGEGKKKAVVKNTDQHDVSKKLAKIELRIVKLEQDKARLISRLETEPYASELFDRVYEQLKQVDQELNDLSAQWESLYQTLQT